MSRESTDARPREELLDEVIASYLDAVALGRPPSQRELLARYPELAAELAEFFDDRNQFDLLASPLREFCGRSTSPERRPAAGVNPELRPSPTPGAADTRTPTFEPRAATWKESGAPPLLDDYEILEELGRGGMGVVYKAWQRSLKRPVALKMLLVGAGTTPDELERFRTEAEIVARLEHPNIVRIHEVGKPGGAPFLSLEFVEGGSLSKRLAGSPLPAQSAAQLVEVLARAIHFAHQCGVVHRDLKPANILLTTDPASGGREPPDSSAQSGGSRPPLAGVVPKVTDFGLAKRLDGDSGQTRSGTVMGTPSYMAPEQAQGHSKAVGPAADVWALGAILYELLTGRPPFRAASPMDTLFQVIQDDPVPPARLQPTCPRDLEIICLKCLQKERHKRYASAEELAEDLRRFQNGETIRARPAGKWERSIKWARRHPAIAALVAVSSLAVLALAGAAVGHDFYLRMKVAEAVAATERADQKREQAEQEKKQAIKEKTLAARRAECRPQLEQARAALAKDKLEHNDLNMAETSASEVRDRTRDELALADLTAEAERLLDRVKRLRGLFRGRDEALFQLNRQLLTGLDRPESLEVADQEARAALALCGVDSEANVGPALDKEVSDSERKEITRGCFHVLLIQADALVWPWVFPPGGKQVGPVKQEVVQQALRILDRANKLVPSTEVYHLRRARYLDLLGQTAEARTARVLARQHQATAPFDLFLVGSERMLEKQGSQAALGDFERALRDDPDLFWARFFLAVGLKLRDPAQARGHLTVCISQRPDFVWCYLIRGFINGEKPLSDFKGAEADFVTAAQLNERRRKEGKPDQSAEYVLLVNRGVLRVRQGRYKEAVEDLEKAAALRPKQFQGHLNLGVAYREQQRRLEAARLFAIPPQPARLAAVLGVAVAGQDWGQWKEVLAQLDEAVKLRPDLALLYRERAQLHLLREDPGAALKDFRRAIDAPEQGERKTHEDYLECGLIHYLEKRYKEAAAACDAALRLRGDYAPAHRLRGEALFERAEHEVLVAEKQRLYREALRSFDNYLLFRGPPKAEVYQFRALAHWGLGNYAAVVGEYNHALTVRPGDPTLLAAQGWAYIALEDWKRARDDFTQAIGRDPTNAQAHNGFGYALVKLGKPIEGVREAREALELGPPTERLFYNAARVFAQASAVEAALAQSSRGSWDKSEDYREEAVRRLVQALALVKEQQRAEFWRKTVRPDSGDLKGALYPLRRSPRFADLAEQYDRPAGGRPQ